MAGLQNDRDGWRRFGPYVSERAWGTVREDYSPNGDAWAYFPHDLAASKAYRARTGWPGSATAIRSWSSPSPSGTSATRS